jgi:transcriptional regulator with XRE-family HTH domain
MEPGQAIREAMANGDYGTVIRLCRQERAMTQGELGRACGYSQPAICRLEQRGPSRTYDVHLLRRVTEALEISPHLLGLADTTPPVNRRQFILAGLSTTLASTVAHLDAAASAAASDQQRQPVLVLLGHAHQALGQLAFDRLHYDTAAENFHSAHQVGVELGDADMIAAALTHLGDVARRRGRYNTALRLLASTERHATAASTLTQVLRSQTLARAHAEIGDRPAFEEAIDRAEELATRISPEHHREGDHSPRGVRLERGQGLTLLGDPKAALAIYADSAPPAWRSDRERGSFAIIEAQALAHAGHLDEGVRRAIEGLDLARSYGSPRHVSRVQRMHDRLARTIPASDPRLVELHDALAA